MRIIQIIDSLDIGGAEKMAVNYANSLSEKIEFSGIVVTRKEGSLKNKLRSNVNYLFLARKSRFDFSALIILRKYLKKNNIKILHAHGTSIFIATIIKIIYFQVKVIWHDHNGERSNQSCFQNKLLLFCTFFVSGIIVVNNNLKDWILNYFKFNNVIYLPNFISNEENVKNCIILKGENKKRILCLANLRNPKNHSLLLDVAKKINSEFPDWTFHLVGKDYDDDYSRILKNKIKQSELENSVFIYGVRDDVEYIIEQSTICVLTSNSEGLPVALLEYGFQKKATICTNVGEIPSIINDGINGFLVPKHDKDKFFVSLLKLIQNETLREEMGNNLHKTILKNHSEETIIRNYLNWI